MRADRLVAIVLLLQTHGQLTAGDLAERLETSERTIRRDLESLSGAGVPVYAQRGRGGGWALLGGHKINLSGLTAEEAEALFLVAGPGALAGLGVEPGVRSALRKLLAALPEPIRGQAAAAGGSVHVDPSGWGRPAAEQPPHLEALRQAVRAGVQIDMDYAKPGRAPEERRVHPQGLVSKGGTWYLLAGGEGGLRTFRVSRVAGVRPTELPVERPDDFDLARAWEGAQEGYAGRMGSVRVDLRVEPSAVGYVRAVLGRWQVVGEEGRDGSGRTLLSASFPNGGVAAADLARFGRRVEVLGPPEVRDALGRLGRELLETYQG